MTTFAETPITYPDTQDNVETPPESLLTNGFIPKQVGVRGQPLPANWLNWLFREVFRKINRDKVKDGNGVGTILSTQVDCFVTIYAMVKSDPTKYLHAMGYKTGTGVPVFKVLSSSVLALGTLTATDTPVTGATASTVAMRVTVSEVV